MAARRFRGPGSGSGSRPGPPRRPPVRVRRRVRRVRPVGRKLWLRWKRRWTVLVRWFLVRPVRQWQRLALRLLGREIAVQPEAPPGRLSGRP